MAPFFDYAIRVGYSRTELARTVDEIQHPSVRECLRYLEIEGGIEIHYVGDLPARTGLGSSSSFTVGLLHALHAFRGDMVSRDQLAREAVVVEHERVRERVGVQDQYTCAHGGLLRLEFTASGGVNVAPIPLSEERSRELRSHLMLLYTGVTRSAHEVLDEQLQRTRDGMITGQLQHLAHLAEQGVDVLTRPAPLAAFGELLHSAWLSKKQLSSKISNSQIDGYYELARRAGAWGGKLLGAGGGGFLLLMAPPDRQDGIEQALKLPRVAFEFDQAGSTLLFCQP
jgi:D-glycero-alpha-D-manno-heptose-7-phosphate kinase